MSRAFFLLFRSERRLQYPTAFHFMFQLVACAISLQVYWWTAKALGPIANFNEQWLAGNFFEFLWLAECVLLLPLSLTEVGVRAVRVLANEGLLDDARLAPGGPLRPILSLALSFCLRDLVQVAFLIFLGIGVYGVRIQGDLVLAIAALIAVSLPVFAGIGLISAALFLAFGRGQGIVHQFSSLAQIMAGAYFPISVFSPTWQSVLAWCSPYTLLLQSARETAIGQVNLTPYWALGAWSLALAALGLTALHWAERRLRKNGLPIFLLR